MLMVDVNKPKYKAGNGFVFFTGMDCRFRKLVAGAVNCFRPLYDGLYICVTYKTIYFQDSVMPSPNFSHMYRRFFTPGLLNGRFY